MSNARSLTRNRISSATGAGAARSPFGVIGAVSLHVLIVASALFTWTQRFEIPEPSDVVPVELVTVGAKTNIAPTVREMPKKVDTEEPKQDIQPPPQPEEKAEPAPSEPIIQKKPPPALPKPRTPEPQKKRTAEDEFNNILGTLTAPQKASPNAKVAPRTTKGIGSMNAATADLEAYLKSLMYQCWSPPAAAPHPEKLIVDVRVFLNPDGSVARPPQLLADSSDPFVRAAGETAIRAIYVCAPYKLPADRYADWREITMRFDPRDAAGIQ
ncbi:MAG: hypothetical protein HY243_17990 [Proteobacteria bacterium]|nr:hypothetical protein [Pseudomonadota bacterium]